MDLRQMLVLVLTFAAVGALLAALTILEKRVLGDPGANPQERPSASTQEPGQQSSAVTGTLSPAEFPRPDAGHIGKVRPPADLLPAAEPQHEPPPAA